MFQKQFVPDSTSLQAVLLHQRVQRNCSCTVPDLCLKCCSLSLERDFAGFQLTSSFLQSLFALLLVLKITHRYSGKLAEIFDGTATVFKHAVLRA